MHYLENEADYLSIPPPETILKTNKKVYKALKILLEKFRLRTYLYITQFKSQEELFFCLCPAQNRSINLRHVWWLENTSFRQTYSKPPSRASLVPRFPKITTHCQGESLRILA